MRPVIRYLNHLLCLVWVPAAITGCAKSTTTPPEKSVAVENNFVSISYSVEPSVFHPIPPKHPSLSKSSEADNDPFADTFSETSDPYATLHSLGGSLEMTPKDLTAVFVGFGVPFPPASTAVYHPTNGQIVVSNTPSNHTHFSNILDKLNNPPSGVEIEKRFFEVQKEKLKAYGLEWRLTPEAEPKGRDPSP